MKQKLFLSHSSKDIAIVGAFVDFMYKIGLTEKDIVCTSVASRSEERRVGKECGS